MGVVLGLAPTVPPNLIWLMEIETLQFDITRINNGPDERPRSSGIHVSHIIRRISNRTVNKGKRQPYSTQTPEEQRRGATYQAFGFAWERMLERSLVDAFASGSIVRPGELCLDGIYGTPDLLDLEAGRLEEWKCTWKSMNKFDDLEGNFWEWTVQIKAYLKMLGLTVCNLRVYFVNGDYRDSGPQVRCVRLQFTQAEIDENWAMILAHKDLKD